MRHRDDRPEQHPAADDVVTFTSSTTQAARLEDDIARWRVGRKIIAAEVTVQSYRRQSRTRALLAVAAGLVSATVAVLGVAQLQDHRSTAGASPQTVPSRAPVTSATSSPQFGTQPTSTGPAAVPGTTAPDPGPTAPLALTQELTSIGGTVTVRCESSKATVQAIQPAEGFTATRQTRGASSQAHVVLASSTHESDIKAHCGPQGLVPTVKETALGTSAQTGTRPAR